MAAKRIFTHADSVVDLIEADYDILPVLSRFSLPLGFGGKTIGELCGDSGINTDVFLLVVNFLLTGDIDTVLLDKVSPSDVAFFLHNSHDYYLRYKIPHIRANLVAALDPRHEDINPIIIRYFDDYVRGVEEHFQSEERHLFPYVNSLTEGRAPTDYSADIFSRQHDHGAEEKLNELKNIILRYYSTSVPYRMYDALVDIYNCEDDLKSHSQIEERILVPLVRKLESRY